MENINDKQNHIVDTNKMVSSVEWLSNQAYELFEQYSEGRFDRITLNKLMLQATEKAKEMEKQQHSTTWDKSMDNFKARGENYVRAYADFDEYYNAKFGGSNE
jgi:hypothetical protein